MDGGVWPRPCRLWPLSVRTMPNMRSNSFETARAALALVFAFIKRRHLAFFRNAELRTVSASYL